MNEPPHLVQHVLWNHTHLNFLFVLEQGSFHNVAELECVRFHLKRVTSHLDTKQKDNVCGEKKEKEKV